MKLNIKNETGKLKSVVLGQPKSMGPIPTLEESYDAKSYHSIEHNIYPKEEDIISEVSAFEAVLKKYDVEVLRPAIIKDYNQVFARDVAFVIEDKMIISNVIKDREDEQEAYRKIFEKVEWRKIINLPETAHIEGGDVIVWNDYLFIGTCYSEDYRSFKTARTNEYAIEILKEYFPKKRIIDLDLKKNDKIPYEGILHLDCTFNPVGKDNITKSRIKQFWSENGAMNVQNLTDAAQVYAQIFKEFKNIITIEDGAVKGGFGSAILEFASENKYTSKITILGIPDEFIEHGTITELQQYCKIDVKSLEILFSSY